MIYLISRVLFVSLVSFCFIFGAASSAKEVQMPSTAERQKIVRVGIYLNFPFVYEKDGLPTGFQVELLKEVAKQEGWHLQYQFLGSLKNVLSALENRTIDLSMGLSKTEERLKFLSFSSEKTAEQMNQIFVHSDRDDIQKIGDLDGKTVGYIDQDSFGTSFIDVCNNLGIHPVTRQIDSYEQLASAVLTDAVDAGIFSTFQGKKISQTYALRATPITFKKIGVFFAAPKSNGDVIISKIDSHLREWKTRKNSPFHRLETEFLQNSLPHQNQWTDREILITVCLCTLLLLFSILLGNFMSKEISRKNISKASIINLLLFIFVVTMTFWILDTFIEWFFFNSEQHRELLEIFITDVPPENLYIRGMFFGLSCFFGLFMARYVSKYEEVVNFLMQNVDRFEQLMDNAPDMICRMAIPSGRYDFVSKASMDICGYSPEEFYKHPRLMEDLAHPDWEDYLAKKWQGLVAGRMEPSYQYQIISKSGETRWLNQRNTFYTNAEGKLTSVEAIVTDITNFEPPATSNEDNDN